MGRIGPPRHTLTTTFLLALALVGAATPAASQDGGAPAGRRPIGVALGGGGARGLAHIGVLQWLDEHRIPVDRIAGTSIGGLIGGGFASGMSPDEIRALVASIDWARMLAPDSPFTDKTFRRKQDARAYPSQLEFGLRGGFNLPSGLSGGQQIDLLLDTIALPYYDITSFDQLPTPFRCVATDLKTAEVVVLESGFLARAMRATIAIPGVFTPVRLGDRLLVDGGVLNNVPADVTRDMGASIVIAVDVGADLMEKKRKDGLFSILADTLDVMMRAGARRALQSADVVLVPDLGSLESTDFGRVDEFARRGYAAAEANREKLERYAVSAGEYAAWVEARRERRRTHAPAPTSISVEGVGPRQALAITRRLRPHLGRPVDPAALGRDVTALAGTDQYEAISYRLAEDGARTSLVITVTPKAYGPPFLLVGLNLENTQSTGMEATVSGRLVAYDVAGPGSEARLEGRVGTQLKIAAELYRPLWNSRLFLAARAAAAQSEQNVFAGPGSRAQYRFKEAGGGGDLGYGTGQHAEVRLGFDAQRIDRTVRIGEPSLPDATGTQRFATLAFTFDGQDDPVIPAHGLYAHAYARHYFHTARLVGPRAAAFAIEPEGLTSAEFDSSVFGLIRGRGRLFVRAAGGTSFGDHTIVNAFPLGGLFRLGAINANELRGSNYLLANAGYLHQLARFAEGALGAVYLGAWVEHGSTFEHLARASFDTDVAGGLIIESPIGPMFLTGSVDVNGRHRIYVGLGPLLHR